MPLFPRHRFTIKVTVITRYAEAAVAATLPHEAVSLSLNMTARQLLQKPLHRHTFSKATALVHCCQSRCTGSLLLKPPPRCCQSCSVATLLPQMRHRHPGAKAAALPCCSRSRCTTMLFTSHRIAMLLPTLSTCCCRDAFANTVHRYVDAAALWAMFVVIFLSLPSLCFLRCSVCGGHGLIVVCHLSFVHLPLLSLSFMMMG